MLKNGKAQKPTDLKYDSAFWDEPNDDNWNNLSAGTQQNIKYCSWSNQFGFPWEIGMYWNLTVDGASHRPQGENYIPMYG